MLRRWVGWPAHERWTKPSRRDLRRICIADSSESDLPADVGGTVAVRLRGHAWPGAPQGQSRGHGAAAADVVCTRFHTCRGPAGDGEVPLPAAPRSHQTTPASSTGGFSARWPTRRWDARFSATSKPATGVRRSSSRSTSSARSRLPGPPVVAVGRVRTRGRTSALIEASLRVEAREIAFATSTYVIRDSRRLPGEPADD